MASAYERAIDYGINPGTVQYSYARALLRMNEFTAKNQANSILEKLANDKSTENGGFWGRMAGEALADAKRTENKK